MTQTSTKALGILLAGLISGSAFNVDISKAQTTSGSSETQAGSTQTTSQTQQTLAGKIWDAANKKFISTSQLIGALSKKQYILIGERHGRKAHQDREAFIIAALAQKGIYPDLYLEMLTQDQSLAVANYLKQEPEYAGRLAIPVKWAESNWPSWQFYQPVFNMAMMAKLPIRGADIPNAEKARINKLDDYIEAYELQVVESWRASMKKAHCDLIKEDRLSKITQLQILRDKAMANAMKVGTDNNTPALLIAGSAHTRNDRGIPRYLDAEKTISLALIEAGEGNDLDDLVPISIEANTLTYDYIWFTPKIEKKTLCDRLNVVNTITKEE